MPKLWLPAKTDIARAARGWPGPNVPPLEPLRLSGAYARASVAFGPDLTRPNFGTLTGDLKIFGTPRYQLGGTYFNGSDSVIDSVSSIGRNSYAFAIRFKNTGATTKDGGLVTLWAGTTAWDLMLWIDTNAGQHRLALGSANAGTSLSIDYSANGSIQRDKTYIATCQATSSTITARLYSDTGQLIDTLSVNNRSLQTRPLRIGARGGRNQKFEGFIYGFWYAETGVLPNQDQIARDFYGTLFEPANQSPFLISVPEAAPATTSQYYIPAETDIARAARGWPSDPRVKPAFDRKPVANARFLYEPGVAGYGVDLVSGFTGSVSAGDPSIVGTPFGQAISGTNDIVKIGEHVDCSGGYIITIQGKWSAIDTWGGIFTLPSNFFNSSHITLQRNSSADELNVFHNANDFWSLSPDLRPSDLLDNKFHTLTIAWDGSNHQKFFDGVAKSAGGPYTVIPDQTEVFGGVYLFCERTVNTNYGSDGEITYFSILPFTSMAEALEVNRSIQRIFEPVNQSPYLISVPSAATGTTLSLPTESVTGQNTATVGCTVAIP